MCEAEIRLIMQLTAVLVWVSNKAECISSGIKPSLLKGTVHPKIKTLPLIHMSFQT